MIVFFPYVVAFIASFLILKRPKGQDLNIVIFFIPWVALGVEIGLSIRVAEMLMILIIVKYFALGYFRLNTFPGLIYLVLYLALGLVAAVATIEFGPDVPVLAGGGVMRNGYGRVVTTLFKTLIFLSFLACMMSVWKNVNVFKTIKSYTLSCVILASIGLVQLAVFLGTGIDLIPIGLLHDPESTRRGTVLIQDSQFLRISSFGGEPKGLGQSLAIALCFLLCFHRQFGFKKIKFFVFAAILGVATLFTNSTSAFVTLLTVLALIYLFSIKYHSFLPFNIRIIFIGIATALVAVFYFTASLTDTLAPKTFRYVSSFWDSILFKVTDRVKLDDTDAIIMESFVSDYFGLFFGRGFGLVHHYAYHLIPPHQLYYLSNAIIVPKSGIANYIGNLGILGVIIICIFLSRLVPSRAVIGPFISSHQAKLVVTVQALCFGLFAAHLLRLYTFEIIWVTFILSYILALHMRLNNKIHFKALAKEKQ